ncbi:MAG TPA: alpha/beta fold hydrolase [Phycisphaerae bacterium]|nr:alpha/beta fold hydrolase [Phycisphaerae bacterium]
MEPTDATYAGADGTALVMRIWRLERPRAAVLYLHGIQSHSRWYEASSRRLAEAGVAVYQIERRGSGMDTAHERGHVDRAEVWLADVALAAERARDETGVAGVHLLGVSWGGKLAVACAAARPDLYRSLILAAPGIVPRVDVHLATKVRVAKCLALGRPLERFPIPLADPHLFTGNPERIRYIAEDPLSLREVTARFMYESRRLDRLVRRAAGEVRMPVFLALAEHDRIIDNQATRGLVEGLPAAPKRIVEYSGASHTLEFETDSEPFFRDLVAWIEETERT